MTDDALDWLDTPGATRPVATEVPTAVTGWDPGAPEGDQTAVVAAPLDLDTLPVPPILVRPRAAWLLGPAGTGKTTLARAIVAQYPGTVLAATTGIAAVNLGEGTTINALLKYFDTASLKEAHLGGRIQMQLKKLYRAGVRRILLDEVSMMDGDQLTILTQALNEFAGEGYDLDVDPEWEEEIDTDEDFQGIGLTVIGDFAQLPPVKAPFAFESPVWATYAQGKHELTTIHRQGDADFREALQACRRGQAGPVVDFFASRMVAATDDHFDGSTILATNEAVSRYNGLRMATLPGGLVTYTNRRWGVQRGDWKQIPDTLGLKVGAVVMILANRREMGIDGMPGPLIYANGDLGTVEHLDPPYEPGAPVRGSVYVRLHRTDQVVDVEWISRPNLIPLEPGRRKALREADQEHLITKDGRFETIGTVEYMPIRVAYATTVHKSQGLTLDQVQVNIREGFFKTPGMVYVALSRCRTAGGLRLVGTPDVLRSRVLVHPKVRPWV